MRCLIIALVCACGAKPPPEHRMMTDQDNPLPVTIEWKVEQGDGNLVNVALKVDDRQVEIGALDAATELEAGTPATCALRAASTTRSEIVCGDTNAFEAELHGDEHVLHVSRIESDQSTVIKRIPVDGETLVVKILLLPGSKL